MDKKFLLKESKTFCMYPWVHLQVDPSGDVKPCCLTPMDLPIGNLNNNSLKEIWNSEKQKTLRKNMLSETKNPICQRCYEIEGTGAFSSRMSANHNFGKHFDIVKTTEEDGTVPEFNMKYMDFRFSNICNFRCRTCGPQLSSRWHSDMKKIYPKSWHKTWTDPSVIKVVDKAFIDWAEIEELIPNLEMIYFAGGEPLIMEEHYRILKILKERKMFHVHLRYNTNFSEMRYKDQNVLEIWKDFDRVEIGASLDGMGKRGEYIRKEQNWEQTENNRREMLKICPKVSFFINATVSNMNVWHLPDFHKDWLDKGFIDGSGFHDNLLLFPPRYRIQVLPEKYKQKVRIKYTDYIKYLKDQVPNSARSVKAFKTILTFLDQREMPEYLKEFIEYTRMLDKIRDEKFEDVFPEWEGLLNEET